MDLGIRATKIRGFCHFRGWGLPPPRQRGDQPGAPKHDHGQQVAHVPEAVGRPHGQLDLVVGRLYPCVRDPERVRTDDGVASAPDPARDLDELGYPTAAGPREPAVEQSASLGHGGHVEHLPEPLLEQVAAPERAPRRP